MPAQTAFAKKFAEKAAKTFDKAKKFKHKTGKSFGKVAVSDGTYSAVITMDASVPTKGIMEGVPIVRAIAAITTGPCEGLEPSQSYFCEGKPLPQSEDEMPTAEQQLLGLLAFLLPDIEIDDIGQVEQAIQLVNERGPLVLVAIRNTKSKTTDKEYQNLYFNKIIKDHTFEVGTITPSQEAEPETTTSDDKSIVDGPDAPTYVPAKGDMVTVDFEGEWEVKQVSQARLTVNVEDADGTRKNGVAWDSLELI